MCDTRTKHTTTSWCCTWARPFSLIAFRLRFFKWSKESTQCVRRCAGKIRAFTGNSFHVFRVLIFSFFRVLIFLMFFFFLYLHVFHVFVPFSFFVFFFLFFCLLIFSLFGLLKLFSGILILSCFRVACWRNLGRSEWRMEEVCWRVPNVHFDKRTAWRGLQATAWRAIRLSVSRCGLWSSIFANTCAVALKTDDTHLTVFPWWSCGTVSGGSCAFVFSWDREDFLRQGRFSEGEHLLPVQKCWRDVVASLSAIQHRWPTNLGPRASFLQTQNTLLSDLPSNKGSMKQKVKCFWVFCTTLKSSTSSIKDRGGSYLYFVLCVVYLVSCFQIFILVCMYAVFLLRSKL